MTDGCPIARGNGSNSADLGEELAPGTLAGIEDGGVAVEDAVGEIGLAQILPDVFGRVEFGAGRRQRHQREAVRNFELARGVPAGPVALR